MSSLETMSSSSASTSSFKGVSISDRHSIEENVLFCDGLKDLKNLHIKLYSAAEFFELSYMNDDQKEIVVTTLKDYVAKALVIAMNHLSSVSYEVNTTVDDRVDEVYQSEFRVSCIEQRMRACQGYIDEQGLSQQSLMITTPRYHKRYIYPGPNSMTTLPELETQVSEMCQQSNIELEENEPQDSEPQTFQTDSPPMDDPAVEERSPELQEKKLQDVELRELQNDNSLPLDHLPIRERPPTFWKARSSSPPVRARSVSPSRKSHVPSPSPYAGEVFLTEIRPPSAIPSLNPLAHSGSVSCKTNLNSSSGRWHASLPKRSASMRQHSDSKIFRGTDKSSKSKGFLKSLLSKRKAKEDEMLYAYLKEY